MLDWPAYFAGLAAMLVLSVATACAYSGLREQVLRTASTIALVWAFGILYISNTGNYDPWEFNLFLDGAAMIAILWHPAGKGQARIGWLFILQIVCHIYYGFREIIGWQNSVLLYYDVLTAIAWVQLLAVGVWCGGIWLQGRLPRLRPDRRAVGHFPDHRVGGEEI